MMLGPGVDVEIEFTGTCIHKHTAYFTVVCIDDNRMLASEAEVIIETSTNKI